MAMESLVNLSSAYEARTLEALTKPFILPVTIVTGFLGSGKLRPLARVHGKGIAFLYEPHVMHMQARPRSYRAS